MRLGVRGDGLNLNTEAMLLKSYLKGQENQHWGHNNICSFQNSSEYAVMQAADYAVDYRNRKEEFEVHVHAYSYLTVQRKNWKIWSLQSFSKVAAYLVC